MAIPDYQTLMLPVLRIAAEGETSVSECTARIAAEYGLTEEDLAVTIQSGTQPLIYNRVAWARTYLVKAGLVEAPRRGVFRATERGRAVLAEAPEQIDLALLDRFEEFHTWRSRSGGETTGPPTGTSKPLTPEEQIAQAARQLDADLRDEILHRLVGSPPPFFERVIIDVMVAMGYGGSREDAGRHLGQSGDGGVDGVINEDALGLDVVFLQAKRYAPDRAVGPAEVREFSGALVGRGARKGIFVTTSRFTEAARAFVAAVREQRIVLMEGDELARMMIRHGIGVRLERQVTLQRIDEDYFPVEASPTGSVSVDSF